MSMDRDDDTSQSGVPIRPTDLAFFATDSPSNPIMGHFKNENGGLGKFSILCCLTSDFGFLFSHCDAFCGRGFCGTIVYEKRFHHLQNGQLYSQRTLGVNVAFGAPKMTGTTRGWKTCSSLPTVTRRYIESRE